MKLATLFNLPNASEVSGIYYEALMNLPDMRFVRLCEAAISECDRMPKPAWFISKAVEMAVNEPLRAKVLPFAEPEGGASSCPPHVRKWLQIQAPVNAELNQGLIEARRKAVSHQLAVHRVQTGRRLESLTASMMSEVERSPDVVAAKKVIDDHRGNAASALAEMQIIAATMTPEEIEEFSFEFTEEDLADIAHPIPPKGEEEEDW
ncbi:MAG: hypothetical protein ACRCZF_14815 [Gemmataceae bacterium]